MQHNGGMRGFPRGPRLGSVKARLGVQPTNQARRNVGGGIQRRLGLGPPARPVVLTGIKARLGGNPAISINNKKRSVASVALGEILDARQKINLSRVQSGRIGDARHKIEEKRRTKSALDGKVKNLRIVADIRQSPRSHALISRSAERHNLGYDGIFRSAVQDAYYNMPPQQQPRRDQYSMRIAPPSEEQFLLTRTIRNPIAGYGGGGMRSDYEGRSAAVRMAPQYSYPHSHPVGMSMSSRGHMDMDMEEDYERQPLPPPPRRQEDSSQSRILVSNLQPSVTADDIVELFSDIGSLIGARMTASGQAEVTYSRKADALKAIEAYHNRLLDGSAMRVFLDSSLTTRSTSNGSSASFTALKSASGATMKLPGVKPSSGIKIQPDISAIHKVLFNPGSSATRGLFKGGQ